MRGSNNRETDFTFHPGDCVKGVDSTGIPYHGRVELIDKKQRILWVQTDIGGRKLIDCAEHTIKQCS